MALSAMREGVGIAQRVIPTRKTKSNHLGRRSAASIEYWMNSTSICALRPGYFMLYGLRILTSHKSITIRWKHRQRLSWTRIPLAGRKMPSEMYSNFGMIPLQPANIPVCCPMKTSRAASTFCSQWYGQQRRSKHPV